MADVARRSVLAAAAGTAGLMLTGTEHAGAATRRPSRYPSRSDYARSLGGTFRVTHAGRTQRVRLTHIRDVPHTPARLRDRCFVLVFVPVGSTSLADGIYSVRRTGVPTRSLFLTSVGTRHAMQAVVNRPA